MNRFKIRDYKEVKGKNYLVSTVKLVGPCHTAFETMVFEEDKILKDWDFFGLYHRAYGSDKEAIQGHKEICSLSDDDFLEMLGEF